MRWRFIMVCIFAAICGLWRTGTLDDISFSLVRFVFTFCDDFGMGISFISFNPAAPSLRSVQSCWTVALPPAPVLSFSVSGSSRHGVWCFLRVRACSSRPHLIVSCVPCFMVSHVCKQRSAARLQLYAAWNHSDDYSILRFNSV